MKQSVKIIVDAASKKAEVLVNGQHLESRIYKYTLEHNACEIPMLHLYMPLFEADIEIEQCEVETHEVDFST